MAKTLYHRLTEAYADANLNRITAALLQLYRAGDHARLRQIAQRISDTVAVDNSSLSKCFSQLVVLYHPDKGETHRRDIKALHAAGRDKELRRFSHVLLLDTIDLPPPPTGASETADFTPEYVYEPGEENLRPEPKSDDEAFEDAQFPPGDEEFDHSFFHALKLQLYGTLAVELPVYYLRDIEEIDMADSGMTSLDGIEHCVYATVVDISSNSIADLSDLRNLVHVTELYAARNQIGYIDALRGLARLRIVDLSINDIDDISPLFNLEHLELVNLAGNNVPSNQLDRLRAKGCTVVS